MDEKKKADFIKVDELYFGKVGHSIKNRFLKLIVDLIFSDRVRKKKFSYASFSMSFLGTEAEWYSNFLNQFFPKVSKVKCFFTKENDSFIVYFVKGNLEATSRIVLPKETVSYVAQRKNEWQGEGKKWELDESSVKRKQEGKQYTLEYKGKYTEKEGEEYSVFEHTVFQGIDKTVFQAFVLKGSDQKVMDDIEKISHSIVMNLK